MPANTIENVCPAAGHLYEAAQKDSAAADLSITKTASPDPVPAGGQITYSLIISNAGPSDAANVTVTENPPPELSQVEFSRDHGLTWSAWPGTYHIGSLAFGASARVFIRGTVPAGSAGILESTAAVSSDAPDLNPDNNNSVVLTPIEPSTDLSVTKIVSPNPLIPGEQATYTITVRNEGPTDARDVILRSDLPESIIDTHVSTDGEHWMPWSGSCSLGTIKNGETTVCYIRGRVSSDSGTEITNTAAVSSMTPDHNTDNNVVTIVTPVQSSADLSISKKTEQSPAVPGESITYRVTVFNSGPAAAQDVVIRDRLSEVITDRQFSWDEGATWKPWNGSYEAGTISSGESVTILIWGMISPDATGGLSDTATVTSSTPDPRPDDNSVTIDTEVTTVADLSLAMKVRPCFTSPGERICYTLKIRNRGPHDAYHVVLTDILPSCLRCASFSVDSGCTWRTWNGSFCFTRRLRVGECFTVLISAAVREDTVSGIENTATVSSGVYDPNTVDNTASVCVCIDGCC